MKSKEGLSDTQLEKWLQQVLPGDKPHSDLQGNLLRIPEQFPQHIKVIERAPESWLESTGADRWLFPLLATTASVVGILVGSMDFLTFLPQQNIVTALLTGSLDLDGMAL